MSSSSSKCPVCGADLPAEAAGGQCPACLLKAALGGTADSSAATAMSDGPGGIAGLNPGATAPREAPGSMIGRYKLLEEIGEGGFGIVYLAEQKEPVKRRVALKVLKPGMDTREVVARFEAERQALALMDHPNIARVFDGGATESGRPYFVMELVKGVPLTKYCDDAQLSTKQRLELFIDVLAAVQHAHQKGIIHRDLKPSNIMVSPHDGKPVIKVIDFGIAKAISMELTEKTLFTGYGRMIGTPQYMSPEQTEVNALDVDTRSDLYSLGVVLYELLTGRTPIDAKKLREAGYEEIQRMIREEEPPKPSTRISTLGEALKSVAQQRGTEPVKLGRQVRGDLDWIVMKALEKERDRRYETANGFAADLRRHLADEPVSAGPPSQLYRLRKLMRRNRGAIAATAAVLATLVAGTIVSVWQAVAATKARDEALYHEGLGWMLRARVAVERKNQYPDTLLYAAQAIGFDGVGRPADAPSTLIRFIRQERNAEVYAGARKWISERAAYLPVWASALRPTAGAGMSFSPEGRRLALGFADGSVHLWDFLDGSEKIIIPPGGDAVGDVAFQPSGKILAIAAGKSIRLWDLDKAAFTTKYDRAASRLAWSPGGSMLGAASADGGIHLWSAGKLTSLSTGQRKPAASLSFSADNSVLAAAFPGSGVRLIFPQVAELATTWSKLDDQDAGALDEQKRPQFLALAKLIRASSAVAMRPDGMILAAGGSDGTLSLWDPAAATLIGQASLEQRHQGAVLSLSFRHDGLQLASASEDGSIRLWEVSDENVPVVIATLTGHRGAVNAVQYAPRGEILASAGADGSARLWNVSGDKASASDLYTYINQHWYGFDPAAEQTLTWTGGAGFANVPANSLTGIWRAGGAEAFRRLMAAGEWTGASVVCPPAGGKELATALLADAQGAAKNHRWNRVDLRLGQLQALGATEGTADLKLQRSAFAQEGQPFTNPTGISLLWCPAGTFTMGSPKDEPGRANIETRHKVTLSHGFWLSKYELTQAQWIAIVGSNPSDLKDSGLDAPVENISWDEAVDFCHRLTDRERACGSIPPGWEYSLPTEAQWEYACRAGTSTTYCFGDDAAQLHRFGNFWIPGADRTQDGKYKHTAPVGRFLPNPWGFHDMHGNVYEWCMDSSDEMDYSAADTVDPLGNSGANRVRRGGGFGFITRYCRAAHRGTSLPSVRSDFLGLRPALVPSRRVSPKPNSTVPDAGVDSGLKDMHSTPMN